MRKLVLLAAILTGCTCEVKCPHEHIDSVYKFVGCKCSEGCECEDTNKHTNCQMLHNSNHEIICKDLPQ